jgi:putative FmdB family regulatory protein
MPTYQYKCPKCGHEYEKLQNINDDSRAKCPKCGTRGERVISGGGGVIFKGSGFYLTDYGRAGQSKDKTEKTESATKSEGTDKADKAAKPAEKPAEKPKPKPKPKGDS